MVVKKTTKHSEVVVVPGLGFEFKRKKKRGGGGGVSGGGGGGGDRATLRLLVHGGARAAAGAAADDADGVEAQAAAEPVACDRRAEPRARWMHLPSRGRFLLSCGDLIGAKAGWGKKRGDRFDVFDMGK